MRIHKKSETNYLKESRSNMINKTEESYWSNRYHEKNTGWDIGYPSTPLKKYIDQLDDKNLKILIPGAGNAYEAEYLFNQGFKNVYVLDISLNPLQALKERVPDFPSNQLLHGDFFQLKGCYDLILEQTFFCSFEPTKENRTNYGIKMNELLQPNGKLVGLWFNLPLTEDSKRPFGGTKEVYLSYLAPFFEVHTFADCYNSIKPRDGNELFGIFKRKDLGS